MLYAEYHAQRMRFKGLIFLLILSIFFPVTVSADTINLKSGQVVKGEIVEEDTDSFKMKVAGDVIVPFFRDEIESMSRDQKKDSPADGSVGMKEETSETESSLTLEQLYEKGQDLLDSFQGDPSVLKQAKIYFHQILEKDPASPYGYLGLSGVAMQSAYQSGRNFNMDKIRESSLPAALKAQEIAPHLYEVHDRLANVYRALHQFEDAEREALEAINLGSNKARSHITMGHVLRYQKKNSEAIQSYEQAIQFNPTQNEKVIIYKNIGGAYNDLKDYDHAIEYFQKAIETQPNSPWIYNDIGLAYQYLEQYDKAIANFSAACQIMSFGACEYNLVMTMGLKAEQEKEIDKAIKFYTEASEMNLADAWLFNRLGYLYLNKQDYEKAKPFLEKAIENDKNYSSPYYNLGSIALDEKDYKVAQNYFQKTIELNPDSFNSYYRLGYAFQMQNQEKEMMDNYKHFMKMKPDSDEAIWLRKNIPPLSGF